MKQNNSFIVTAMSSILNKLFHIISKLKWYVYYNSIKNNFSSFGTNVRLDYDINFIGEKNISIGNNVFIGKNCIINAGKGGYVFLGEGCAIGANSTIITWNLDNLNNRGLVRSENHNIFKNVTIGKGVGVGYGVTINPGITLGNGCEVAAGSVVARDVKPFEIVAGVPAVVIGIRKERD